MKKIIGSFEDTFLYRIIDMKFYLFFYIYSFYNNMYIFFY